jgi:hypothetical protein
VKEDVAFVLAPLGLWVALKADKKRGLITSVASLATMALMFLVVMRSFTGVAFRNSWRIPFGGFSGLLKTAFTQPTKLIAYLWSEDRPVYVWQMHLLDSSSSTSQVLRLSALSCWHQTLSVRFGISIKFSITIPSSLFRAS